MNFQHKKLAGGKWQKLSFIEQMANIGSEVERAIKWSKKNCEYSRQAFERVLELLDLTISDKNNLSRLKELVRLREILVDYFQFNNIYQSTDQKWQNYFYAFNYAARLGK